MSHELSGYLTLTMMCFVQIDFYAKAFKSQKHYLALIQDNHKNTIVTESLAPCLLVIDWLVSGPEEGGAV